MLRNALSMGMKFRVMLFDALSIDGNMMQSKVKKSKVKQKKVKYACLLPDFLCVTQTGFCVPQSYPHAHIA